MFRVERCGFMACVPFVIPADKEGVEIRMGARILSWCARRVSDGRIVGVAQAWRSGSGDHTKPGGAWRMSGLFVDPAARGKGAGFALQKARVEWLRDVQKADSIDSFAFKPAPLVALGFSPVREFKMGTTRMLWERGTAGAVVKVEKGKALCGKTEKRAKGKRVAVDAGGWIDVEKLTAGGDVERVVRVEVKVEPIARIQEIQKPEPKRVVQLGLGF